MQESSSTRILLYYSSMQVVFANAIFFWAIPNRTVFLTNYVLFCDCYYKTNMITTNEKFWIILTELLMI